MRPPTPVACQSASSTVSVGDAVMTPGDEIRWGTFISEQVLLADAVNEAVDRILPGLGAGASPTLAMVFVAAGHEDEFEHLVPLLRQRVPSLQHVFGCSGYGVVGSGDDGPQELEGLRAGLSLTLGQLPGVEVKVFHTLRSSIPKEDDPPERWGEFVGVPHTTHKNTSFILLADPRFQQIRDITRGLDYAFRKSTKIGGVLSAGPESHTRTMFAWSADGLAAASASGSSTAGGAAAAAGKSGRRYRSSRKLQRERLTPANSASSPSSSSSTNPPTFSTVDRSSTNLREGAPSSDAAGSDAEEDSAATSSPVANFFESVVKTFIRLTGGDQTRADATAVTSSTTGSSARSAPTRSREESDADPSTSSGTYLHGAIGLVLHGDVVIETIVATGYRCPSNKIYRVDAMEDGSENTIAMVVREPSPYYSSSSGGSSGSSISTSGTSNGGPAGQAGPGYGPGSTSTGSGLLPPRRDSSNDDSSDDDDEEEDEDEEMGGALPAIAAIVELLDAFRDEPVPREEWDELLESARVAVASFTDKPWDQLDRADFRLLHLIKAFEETGQLLVDGMVCKGDRIRIMVKDALGCRDDLQGGLLNYKRQDLQAMLSGKTLPRTFGVLMFSDVDHCDDFYAALDPPSGGASRGFGGEAAITAGRTGRRTGGGGTAGSTTVGGTAPPPTFRESRAVAGYLPVPTSGMFGGAQIARDFGNSITSLLEESCVIGVLRAVAPSSDLPPAQSPPHSDDQAPPTSSSSSSSGDSGSLQSEAQPLSPTESQGKGAGSPEAGKESA